MARLRPFRPALLLAFLIWPFGITTRVFGTDAGQVEPEVPNSVYWVNPKDDSLTPLERETPEVSASSNSLTGAVKGQMIVQGQKSPVRLKLNQTAEFAVRPVDPSQYFGVRLERFEAKDGKRILKF